MSGVVAVVSSDPGDAERIRRACGSALEVISTIDPGAMMAMFEADSVIAVSADRAAAVLAAFDEQAPPIVVLGEPAEAPADPRVAHVARRNLTPEHLRALLVCLAERHPVHAHGDATPQNAAEARRVQQAFAASRRLAGASDLASTEQLACDALLELIDCDRAYCLYHDADDGALWSETRLRSAAGDERRAIAGLAGWSARTGLPALAPHGGDDPRYLAELDDPQADPTAQIATQPVIGADGQVHAVLVAVRRARRSELGDNEAALLKRFAALAAPLIDTLSVHVQSQAILEEAAGDPGIFRKEALDAQILPKWGDVIRVAPGWLSWAYWMLVVLLIASAVFVTVGRISTYSSGPAVIRSKARTEIAAHTAGNVTAVELGAGDTVHTGDVLARLDDADQRAAVDRLSREFEGQLRNHMLDPSDNGAETSLRGLRLDLESARTALEQRLVRANADGVVGDVRVHPGQHVDPGDIVASLSAGTGGLEIIAVLPGEDRPQLAAGMPLRFELSGYKYSYNTVTIEDVENVMSPAEAQRTLGRDVANFQLTGPVVLVHARVPSTEFEADGKTFKYHDGMLATADVAVRSERILFALVPGLRRF